MFIDVDETLAEGPRGHVVAIESSFHAGIAGRSNRPVFRYDNAHPYTREGHFDNYHRHRFDYRTWREIESPEWIGRDRWPRLDEVIEELRQWWETTGSHLDLGRLDDQGAR